MALSRNVTASGTTVADATPISPFAAVVEIKTVPPGTGVALPFSMNTPSRRVLIWNRQGVNAVLVYATASAGTTGSATVNGTASYSMSADQVIELSLIHI